MKKAIICIITGIFMLGVLVGCGAEEILEEELVVHTYIGEEDIVSVENETLELSLDPLTTTFVLKNKETGAKWYSNPVDADSDPLASGDSANVIQSTLLVEYINDIGVGATLNNFKYSITDQFYDIESGDDYIKVNYTIGSPQKEYVIPMAISEERFQGYLDKMDSSDARKTKENYKKYDINDLSKSDEEKKDELLESYPALENEILFILRETVKDYQKEDMQHKFESAGYTMEEYLEDVADREEEGEKPIFNVSVIYRLEGNDFIVEVPMEEMEWKTDYQLTSVSVLPMFGAGSTADEGYLVVPDGMGAVIEFNNNKTNQLAYQSEVYGWDYGMKREYLIQDNRSSFGAYAIANNNQSMLCILEDGASLASVKADISGKGHSYNTVYSSYSIVKDEAIAPSYKSYQTIIMFDEHVPDTVLTQRYQFVEGTDYNTLAMKYGEYLKTTYDLEEIEQDTSPIYVELVGAIDLIKQQFGIPKSMLEPLTTFDEATKMLAELKEMGIKDLNVIYSGWLNGGVSHDFIGNPKPLSILGGSKDFKSFIEAAKEHETEVYINAKVQSTLGGSFFEGFSVNQDVARHITREYNERYPFSFVWYGEQQLHPKSYMLAPNTAMDAINSLEEVASKYDVAGIALQDVGMQLVADYNPKKTINREESMNLLAETIQDTQTSGIKTITNGGNAYTLGYSEVMLNLDLNGNESVILDYAIPFYPIAIHGLVNYTGTPINLTGDYTKELLKSVEYGAGLSFTLMDESVITIQETSYSEYYGAEYDRYKEELAAIYDRYESELGHCFGQAIVDHEKLSQDVFVTTYEDGTQVYVNYSEDEFKNSKIVVPSREYVVERRAE